MDDNPHGLAHKLERERWYTLVDAMQVLASMNPDNTTARYFAQQEGEKRRDLWKESFYQIPIVVEVP